MKIKLIQTKDYLLLIDEEAEIKEGKTFITKDNIIHSNYGYNYGDRVVIAYYPLTKEAKELNLPLLPNPFKEQPKQFSLEDMKRAIEMAREMKDDEGVFDVHSIRGLTEVCTYDWEERYSEKEIIQSLSTRQLPKGFIPEYQRVRDWDSRDINGDYNSKLQLKTIINSEGKQELVGTYK